MATKTSPAHLNGMTRTLDINLAHIETFDDAAKLLRGTSVNRVAKAMDLFSRAPQEARAGVYEALYRQIRIAHPYWGCAEHAFHDQNGLTSTPEQKAQAIESHLSQMVASARLNLSEQAGSPKAIHFLFRRAAEELKGGTSRNSGMDLFARMPKDQREKVYGEFYQMHTFSNDYWGCAEDAFHDRNGLSSTVEEKAQAIQNYLLRDMADLLKSSDPRHVETAFELIARMLAQQKGQVYGELYDLLKPFANDYYGCAEDAFHGRGVLHATPEQRAQAVLNCIVQKPAPQNPAAHLHFAPVKTPAKLTNPAPSTPAPQKPVVNLLFAPPKAPANVAAPSIPGQHEFQAQVDLQIKRSVEERKAKHIRELEARCQKPPQPDPDVKPGECFIKRSSTYTEKNPTYTLIVNKLSQPNYRLLITFDETNGDIACCGFTFNSLEELLLNYNLKPIAQLPVIDQKVPLKQPSPPNLAPTPSAPVRAIPAPVVAIPQESDPVEPLLPGLRHMQTSPIPIIPAAPPVLAALPKRLIPVPAGPFLLPRIEDQLRPQGPGAPAPTPDKPPALVLIAAEPVLAANEVVFEQQEAQDLFDFGLRSVMSRDFINDLSNFKSGSLEIRGNLFDAVSGSTQDFSKRRLVSCGSSPTREIIVLDPSNSPALAAHYVKLRQTLRSGMTTRQVLNATMQYVRNEVFPSCKQSALVSKTDRMVENARLTHPTVTNKNYPSIKIPMIPIDDFVTSGIGVCRHHGLVTAYLLDRLLSEENPLIEGTVQHIRGNLDGFVKGAHVWTTFIPKRKSESPAEKWHFDTLWEGLTNYADARGLETLILSYGRKMMDDQIRRTTNAARKNGQE